MLSQGGGAWPEVGGELQDADEKHDVQKNIKISDKFAFQVAPDKLQLQLKMVRYCSTTVCYFWDMSVK